MACGCKKKANNFNVNTAKTVRKKLTAAQKKELLLKVMGKTNRN